MADIAFTADSTMPGLSSRDLARRVLAFLGAGSDAAENKREVALRSLAGLDRHALRDIGLDLDAS